MGNISPVWPLYSGYCPPEMARVVRDALLKGAAPGDERMAAALATYTADVAYDMWSFGVVGPRINKVPVL